MTPLAPHLTAFFQERLTLERQVSVNTCDSYAYAFKLLLNFASKRLKASPSRIGFEQMDASLVVAFLNDLESKRSNATSSRNVRLAAIRSFMRFMEYRLPSALEQIQRVLAIPMKKTDTRLVRHLNTEEIQALLDAPQPTDWSAIRDRAMLHLCFAAGLRVSELTSLRLEDLSLQPHGSILVRGKGRRERCLPLWKQTVVAPPGDSFRNTSGDNQRLRHYVDGFHRALCVIHDHREHPLARYGKTVRFVTGLRRIARAGLRCVGMV